MPINIHDWKNRLHIISQVIQGKFLLVIWRKPIIGDTITINGISAEFKKIENNPSNVKFVVQPVSTSEYPNLAEKELMRKATILNIKIHKEWGKKYGCRCNMCKPNKKAKIKKVITKAHA